MTALGLPMTAFAQDDQTPRRRVVVEDIPPLHNIHKVSASQTHSGFPVPRYVSLKYGRVNGRKGPSTHYPIAWEYHRNGLPLVVVAEMDIWRKVRDMHGDESWVRTQALSGARRVIVMDNLNIYKKPKTDSSIVATATPDTLLRLEDCKDQIWCKVKSDNGFKGWVERSKIWGAEPL